MENMNVWKNYPDKKYKVAEEGKPIVHTNKRTDFNPIVRYIMYMYDKNSPFHKRFSNIDLRKTNALSESGMDEELLSSEEVVDMIVSFLVYQRDKLWSVICTNENLFIEYLSVLNTKFEKFNSDKDIVTTLKVKEEVRKFLDSLRINLEAQYEEFYNGDKNLKEVVEKKVRFTPETVSSKLSK